MYEILHEMERIQSETSENDAGVLSNDGGVTSNLDLLGRLVDWGANNNDSLSGGGSLGELSEGRNGGGGTSSASLGTSICARVSKGARISDSSALGDLGPIYKITVLGWGWCSRCDSGQKTSGKDRELHGEWIFKKVRDLLKRKMVLQVKECKVCEKE